MFRSPELPEFDHRDTAQHKRLLSARFADGSWRVPELLERMQVADDLYFDSVGPGAPGPVVEPPGGAAR